MSHDAAAPTHFAFLIRRSIDRAAWPLIWSSLELAQACEHRVSAIVPVTLLDSEPLSRPQRLEPDCPQEGKST